MTQNTAEFLSLKLKLPEQGHGTMGHSLVFVEGIQSIRQAIIILLATEPGERVMRPDYGCDLNRLVFSPNDDTTAGLAIYYVRSSIERWEPRIEIMHLDATRGINAPEQLVIDLTYRVKISGEVDEMKLAVNLSGDV